MGESWYTGNAAAEAGQYRGWFIGDFIGPADDAADDAADGPADGAAVRKTSAVEVKWGIHPAGQKRHAWNPDHGYSTLVILVSGRFRVDLGTGSVTLERQGDYLVWGEGIGHSWLAEEDSLVITVRWPSAPR